MKLTTVGSIIESDLYTFDEVDSSQHWHTESYQRGNIYYGITDNSKVIASFRFRVTKSVFYWLNKRSQGEENISICRRWWCFRNMQQHWENI